MSTNLAVTLSVCCPLMFVLSSLLQYAMFWLFHRSGHPWHLILKEALAMHPEKVSRDQERDSSDQSDEVQTSFIAAKG